MTETETLGQEPMEKKTCLFFCLWSSDFQATHWIMNQCPKKDLSFFELPLLFTQATVPRLLLSPFAFVSASASTLSHLSRVSFSFRRRSTWLKPKTWIKNQFKKRLVYFYLHFGEWHFPRPLAPEFVSTFRRFDVSFDPKPLEPGFFLSSGRRSTWPKPKHWIKNQCKNKTCQTTHWIKNQCLKKKTCPFLSCCSFLPWLRCLGFFFGRRSIWPKPKH